MPRNPPNWLVILEHTLDEGYGEFEDYYKPTIEEHPTETRYYGRNVIWIGEEDRMLRVRAAEMEPIEGNIFDADKLAAVVDGVVNHPDRIELRPGYVHAHPVTPNTVKESLEYEDDEPFTTGDEDLDAWLVDPETAIDDGLWESDTEAKAALAEAVDSRDGDLGSWRYQLRDGNHRAWGALLGGEPYIYVYLAQDQYDDAREQAQDPESWGHSASKELLDMLE